MAFTLTAQVTIHENVRNTVESNFNHQARTLHITSKQLKKNRYLTFGFRSYIMKSVFFL
uniref:Uncharacterized protein n=1 Tax=Helianthus annuus TaxID=4232 RepID=A0A251SP14_HELAN